MLVAFYCFLGFNVAHKEEVEIMAENAVVRARINETIKEEAATVLATMGLSGDSIPIRHLFQICVLISLVLNIIKALIIFSF